MRSDWKEGLLPSPGFIRTPDKPASDQSGKQGMIHISPIWQTTPPLSLPISEAVGPRREPGIGAIEVQPLILTCSCGIDDRGAGARKHWPELRQSVRNAASAFRMESVQFQKSGRVVGVSPEGVESRFVGGHDFGCGDGSRCGGCRGTGAAVMLPPALRGSQRPGNTVGSPWAERAVEYRHAKQGEGFGCPSSEDCRLS